MAIQVPDWVEPFLLGLRPELRKRLSFSDIHNIGNAMETAVIDDLRDENAKLRAALSEIGMYSLSVPAELSAEQRYLAKHYERAAYDLVQIAASALAGLRRHA